MCHRGAACLRADKTGTRRRSLWSSLPRRFTRWPTNRCMPLQSDSHTAAFHATRKCVIDVVENKVRRKVVLIAKCKYWVFPQVGADHPGCKIVTHPLSLFALSTAREMSFCECKTSPTTINTHTQKPWCVFACKYFWQLRVWHLYCVGKIKWPKTWRRRLWKSEMQCVCLAAVRCQSFDPGMPLSAVNKSSQGEKRRAGGRLRYCSCSVWQTEFSMCALQTGVKYLSGVWQIPPVSLPAITCRISYETELFTLLMLL